jgi:hypothetical protein
LEENVSNQSANANSRDQGAQDPFSKSQERTSDDTRTNDEIRSPGQHVPGTAKVAAEEEDEDELDSTDDDEFEEADDEDDEAEGDAEDEETEEPAN